MKSKPNKVYLISNGDFRDSAGEISWPKQEVTLRLIQDAFSSLGVNTEVHPPYDAGRNHGFITKQCTGAEIFSKIELTAPVVIVLSCWAYAHHVAGCLQTHKGPILLVANFNGTYPGLVALLNHAATLERLCVRHSRLWSETFAKDPAFMERLDTWCQKGEISYDISHLIDANRLRIPKAAKRLGHELARDILTNKRIMGQLDPGCMGMLNAVINPTKLGAIGMPLELLNQSDLVAEMGLVDDREAQDQREPGSTGAPISLKTWCTIRY